MSLGYIPPVRDDQSIQYGLRKYQVSEGIVPVAPVAKGSFYSLLADQNRKYVSSTHTKKSPNHKELSRTLYSEITGKGMYIDLEI
ncbi:hypothetical protein DS745_17930 [Anaerobacillus alkaliphilus]|uniref:Uncharacterized protein n=1 Tax=Anaerobacillus alkaliphilus TaxID=1548597 RepID=A0A4Q0VP54_9BACI|nr:hypothetical protein [Anaerobacillus alkaliphilus]RXI98216.1 hypothetical protein DS745_17930 [Anaerobacillus alkaliphilus]